MEQPSPVNPLDLVGLTALMERTCGSPDVVIGLLDGPVAVEHPDLGDQQVRALEGGPPVACRQVSSAACRHGTFVAGILVAKRGSLAPAICPNCTLLVRPIFDEAPGPGGELPSASPRELAAAIVACIDGGARVLNVSVALRAPTLRSEPAIDEAVDYAARRGVVVVAAAGNQGTIGSWALTRHPWVIPITACDSRGRPLDGANLALSIGRRGLRAPGGQITSLGASGGLVTWDGTSAAVPFVTGTIALLWSLFPTATAGQLKRAVTCTTSARRTTVVPPLLNAGDAYDVLVGAREGTGGSRAEHQR